MDPILERAARWGIETRYRRFGRLRTVEPEMLVRLLGVGDDAAAARMLPRTIVVRGERDRAVAVAAAEGQALRWKIAGEQTIAEGGAAPSLTLPPRLPTGLFRLRVTATAAGRLREEIARRVRIGPIRATHPRHGGCGRWPCSSTASARPQLGPWRFHRSLGLVELAADLGASGVGLNPLHALFDDRPSEPSPYFPNSRLFLNPLYIDLDAVPDFPVCARRLEAGVERLRDGQGRLPRRGRRAGAAFAYGNFRQSGSSERRDAFDRFRRARGRCWRVRVLRAAAPQARCAMVGMAPAMAKGERRGARRSAANRGGRTWLLRVRAVVGA